MERNEILAKVFLTTFCLAICFSWIHFVVSAILSITMMVSGVWLSIRVIKNKGLTNTNK